MFVSAFFFCCYFGFFVCLFLLYYAACGALVLSLGVRPEPLLWECLVQVTGLTSSGRCAMMTLLDVLDCSFSDSLTHRFSAPEFMTQASVDPQQMPPATGAFTKGRTQAVTEPEPRTLGGSTSGSGRLPAPVLPPGPLHPTCPLCPLTQARPHLLGQAPPNSGPTLLGLDPTP